MPLLAYCVVLGRPNSDLPPHGIFHSKIEPIADFGLIALCSEIEQSSVSAANFQQTALEFHRVIQSVLAQQAVIPFRFPTWLSSEQVKAHLHQESSRYESFLSNHACHVQMEVRIAREADSTQPAAGGAEHLRARAAQFRKLSHLAEEIRSLVADSVIEWRERENPDGIRMYALVSRESIEEFREKLSRASIHTSGPWPATEFLNQPPR